MAIPRLDVAEPMAQNNSTTRGSNLMTRGHFRTPREALVIEIRPRCPKCKREFMLNLKNYLPGKHHACFACGTVTQFDTALAEKLQKQINDLEMSIQQVFERFFV